MPLVMFVLAYLGLNIVGQTGYSVSIIYKETESNIYIYKIIFSKVQNVHSFSLCMPSRLCMLSAITEPSLSLHFLFQQSLRNYTYILYLSTVLKFRSLYIYIIFFIGNR